MHCSDWSCKDFGDRWPEARIATEYLDSQEHGANVMSPEDRAAMILAMNLDDRADALGRLSKSDTAATLSAMPLEDRNQALSAMSPEDKSAVLHAMSLEERAGALQAMTPDERDALLVVLAKLPPKKRQDALDAMSLKVQTDSKKAEEQGDPFLNGRRILRNVALGDDEWWHKRLPGAVMMLMRT
jgi:hypothetical protein